MKNLIIILLSILFFSCSTPTKEDLLIGNWKVTSITDTEKGKTNNVKDYMNVNITKDSIYVKMEDKKDMANGSYSWFLKNDTINVVYNSVGDIQIAIIKELNGKQLIVDMKPFLGDLLLFKFKKNSN